MSIGPTITPHRSNGYTHALRVLFKDEASLRAYDGHPEHVLFKNMLNKNELDGNTPWVICVDWNAQQ